jgi:hypothetical protein
MPSTSTSSTAQAQVNPPSMTATRTPHVPWSAISAAGDFLQAQRADLAALRHHQQQSQGK